VTGPQDATVGDSQVRIAGRAVGDAWIVVAQTLDAVAQAQGTIILAELIIGPVLLLVVFLGAVAIGRRVATPIETARRRQLEFTADASHELRTPLSVIEAHTSLALTQDRTEDWYRTAFGRVDLESKRMRRLLDDLLWLARFDATQGQPDTEPVDLGILAAQTADRFGVVAEARRLDLRVEVPDESLVISAPPEWLDRLIGVLLDNACKYSPDGGTVALSVVGDRSRIALAVDDSGPGIPEDERDRIFDRFHRVNTTGEGAGLGLAIADAIVRATGGQWRIGTSPAGGARMSVSWPRALGGQRETAPSPSVAPPDAAPDPDGT
jgi:signal transduction histidine kinase